MHSPHAVLPLTYINAASTVKDSHVATDASERRWALKGDHP